MILSRVTRLIENDGHNRDTTVVITPSIKINHNVWSDGFEREWRISAAWILWDFEIIRRMAVRMFRDSEDA